MSCDESQLRHPAERPLFLAFAVLNVVLMAAAICIVLNGSNWLREETREGGDPTKAELGPSVEFYLKPWLKLKDATIFDLDEAKKRALVLTAGYRYLPSPNAPSENRLRLDLTFHFPMKAKILISDRNRSQLSRHASIFASR